MNAPRHADSKLSSRLVRLLPYLGVALGLAIIAFYPASEAIDAWRRGQIAVQLDQTAAAMDTSRKDELLAQAHAYNQRLAGEQPDIADRDIWPYKQQLSEDGADTAFAYIVIPGIDLTMPVYHGTDNAALSAGVGHLEQTSLPVGGESTHAALSAHSGMSGMRAFDEIDQLEPGDVFGIRVLGDLYCYRVMGSETVLPEEEGLLEIEAGRDLCTLITCTPYGVNDHRLLVRGERCAVPDGFGDTAVTPADIVTSRRVWPLLLAIAAIVAVAIALFVNRRLRTRRKQQ